MTASNSTTWFWTDWLGDPAVRALTYEERGLWIDMLALAAQGTPPGYITDHTGRSLTPAEIARLTGGDSAEVERIVSGILTKGAASKDGDGRIYNRRMVRDLLKQRRRFAQAENGRLLKQKAGQKGGRIAQANRRKLRNAYDNLLKRDAKANAQADSLSKTSTLSFPSEESSFGTQSESQSTGGSLASALPTGALRSPPDVVQNQEPEGPRPKRPHELTAKEAIEQRRHSNEKK